VYYFLKGESIFIGGGKFLSMRTGYLFREGKKLRKEGKKRFSFIEPRGSTREREGVPKDVT